MTRDIRPFPRDGYHYLSSRRYPREPEISAGRIPGSARFVGRARIDGAECRAFRFRDEQGRPRYGFQTAT